MDRATRSSDVVGDLEFDDSRVTFPSEITVR